MGNAFTRLAGGLALAMVTGGIACVLASVWGLLRYFAQVESGERLYDGMPMLGIFIGGASGLCIAVCGWAAWKLRGRRSGYVFLLLGWLLCYFPAALVISGFLVVSRALVRGHLLATLAGAAVIIAAAVAAGHRRRYVGGGGQ